MSEAAPFQAEPGDVASCLGALRFLSGADGEVPSTLVVAAHPDDEVIGLGGQLARLAPRVHVLQVTDGAPHDMKDARECGFATREAYADERRRELLAALAEAGIGPERSSVFGIADQAASLDLVGLARRMGELITWLRPQHVVAPAYEGGHPDHDAAAFATWAARALLRRSGMPSPESIEFPLYHAGPTGIVTGRFLPGGPPALVLRLDAFALERKHRMVERFPTQQKVLAAFRLESERFRCTPERDFRLPPHEGRLYYESFDRGMDGERWRSLAAAALADLELPDGRPAP